MTEKQKEARCGARATSKVESLSTEYRTPSLQSRPPNIPSERVLHGFDHINRNAPVLIRTPKLTRFEPAQYWGGGPPGNSVVLNPSFYTNVSKKAGVLRIFFLSPERSSGLQSCPLVRKQASFECFDIHQKIPPVDKFEGPSSARLFWAPERGEG